MKTVLTLITIFLCWSTTLGAEENGTLLFRFEGTPVTSRLGFLKAQAPALLTDDFLIKALTMTDDLGIESGPQAEAEAKKDTAVWLCQMLTRRKNTDAIPLLRGLADQYKDPVLRGEAFLDLARLGDKPTIPALVRNLRMVNNSAQKTRGDEILAFSLVQACGELGAGEAFSEVLKASQGWYSPQSQIRDTARRVLPKLSGGLTENLLAVLKGDDDLTNRDTAFQYLLQSSEPGSSARAAATALDALRTLQPRAPKDKELVDRMKKTSLRTLVSLQPPAETVPSLKTVLESAVSDQEDRVLTVQVLGKIASEDSTAVLIAQLKKYNQRQKNGANTSDDVDLVRELISALGKSGNPKAKEVLADVEFSDFTPALAQEARNALKKIGGN